jgi:photosystem II stability/assembly factor-like uncharacterized protein
MRGLIFLFVMVPTGVAADSTTTSSEYALQAPLAQYSLLLDAAAVANRLVVVGERGHILISEDDGTSWTQVLVPTQTTLTAVYFLDPSRGWATGHDAVILRTDDGGRHWRRMYYAPEKETPLFDIWFRNKLTGLAIGAYGLVLKTSDGGIRWRSVTITNPPDLPTDTTPRNEAARDPATNTISQRSDYLEPYDFHLNHIAESADGRLYIAGEAGNLLRSDDRGETWFPLPSPYHGSFFGVLPLGNDSLLVFGLRGHMYRSEDAGNSWSRVNTGTQKALNDGCVFKDGTVVVVGLGGTLLVSWDDGRTFSLRQLPERTGLSAIVQAAHDAVVVVGEAGVKRLPRSFFSPKPGEAS